MELQFFCPRWGNEQLDWRTLFLRARDAGYAGLEYAIPGGTPRSTLDEVWNLAAQTRMQLIAQHYDTHEPDFFLHADRYAEWMETIGDYPVTRINAQTGKDYFSFEQNTTLIAQAGAFCKMKSIPLSHETHRGRFSYSAPVSGQYLKRLPGLRITLDLSHWVTVAESYLYDQQEVIAMAIERTDHIHARIGYPQGPQVPDPSKPEWEEAASVHLECWKRVIRLKAEQGQPVMTLTPEFGPYPYMIRDPHTGRPLADQWKVNCYMMELIKTSCRKNQIQTQTQTQTHENTTL